jgi:flagellar motor switch protein FliN/FliY
MSTQEAVISVPTQEALQYLDQEIRRCLISSLASMLAGPSVTAVRDNGATAPAGAIWFSGVFTGEAAGSLLFALDDAEAVAMGHKLLFAAGLEGESDATAIETLAEILSQVNGGLASSFLSRLKKEVAAQPLAKMEPPGNIGQALAYQLTTSDGDMLHLCVLPEAKLINSITLQPAEAPTKAITIGSPAPIASPSTRNLELLLDVELPVSVSFGRAQLQLKDVIKLTTGSIVELNRSVSEPVDIIVNNCVIARGEVVVVEGNFGVRIKQILSKEDRLRSLG